MNEMLQGFLAALCLGLVIFGPQLVSDMHSIRQSLETIAQEIHK